jgi:hypothetical protein
MDAAPPRMMFNEPIILIGPGDEVDELDEKYVLDDDEDEGPSSLDHEALNDDAC